MKKILAALLVVTMLASSLSVMAAAEPVATIGTEGYTSLQAAVKAYTNGGAPIVLQADTAEAISISKDVYLDLNGNDVTGAITVSAGTLYCMDSQTDDYTVKDTAGYGKLTNVTGNVAGVPVEATCAEDGYLMIEEDTALSFHRVNLQIYAMSLRSECAGVYYKSHFAADEKVADKVVGYGIALSVKAAPTAENLATHCKYINFTDFQAGENGSDATSVLLKNVMKPTNAALQNNVNSQMVVYGRSYILISGNRYFFGETKSRSFKEQVQLAASNTYWSDLEDAQQDATVSLYRTYTPILRTWGLKNVESALCLDKSDPLSTKSETLKVLAITSSFGLNTTQLLYDVAVAEGYAPEDVTVARLYTSGCTLEKHINHAPSTPVYQYTKISGDPDIVAEHVADGQVAGKMFTVMKEGEATLLDGLLDEEWDIIFMQQGAAQAPQLNTYVDSKGNNRIDVLRDIMKSYVEEHCPNARFVWNMLWGYQSDSTISPFPTIFNSDQMYMYQCNIDAVMKYVIPRTDYDRIIPTGTVIQNARSSQFGDNLCRDTYHLNNYGAILAAYGLFAVLTGQELESVNIDAVTASATNGIGGAAKITTPLTATQKAIIKESVNNALKDPFGVTQSQYPQKDYSSYTYTENLSFIDNTDTAVCPACDQEVSWIEINQDNVKTLESNGYLGNSLASGTYHFYLSSNVSFTAETATNSFLHMPGGGRNVCLHLNGNDLTATNCAISIMAGTAKLNVMGTGTVSGNHTNASKFRGSAFVLNSGETTTSGTLRLYSGTYVQPASSTQLAPVSTSFQGGKLEIFSDATITGNAGSYSVCLNAANNKNDLSVSYPEIVNIYGGTFNRPVYVKAFTTSTLNTVLNIQGGTFNNGIEIVDCADVTLSGAPVIKGAGLKLPEGTTVTLDALTDGASIAVDASDAFTVANTNAANYLKYFTSANGGKITVNNDVLYSQPGSIYTANLSFDTDSNTALCPSCGENKEWIEINQDNLSTLVQQGYLGKSLAEGTYHFYLSSNIEFTAADSTVSFLHAPSSNRNICLHLNGNDLTATNCAISIMAGTAKFNVMGTGTVTGNHTHNNKYRGSAFVLNSGTNATNPGTLRLYSGTYVQPASNSQLAPICLAQQGGLLEIYADATLTGNASNNSLFVNTTNQNYTETVNIYGGTFNRPVHFEAYAATTTTTALKISGGTFNDGIKIVNNTNVTLSGAPVISGAGLILPEGTTVTLDALTDGASIAVDASGAFTAANTNASAYLEYFSAVKGTFSITVQDNIFYCTENN